MSTLLDEHWRSSDVLNVEVLEHFDVSDCCIKKSTVLKDLQTLRTRPVPFPPPCGG